MTVDRLPVITDPDHVLEWMLDHWWPLDVDAVEVLAAALSRVGRTNGPFLLSELYCEVGQFTPEIAALAASVWSACDYPQDAIPTETWTDLFALAGYTVDAKPSARPDGPLRLYRGAPAARRTNMSWTSDVEVARRFASGDLYVARQSGEVWTAIVEPGRLFAQDNGRQESEYVINTRGLEIERAGHEPPHLDVS